MPAIQAILFISSLIGLGAGQTAKINLGFPMPQLVAKVAAAPPLTCQIEVDFYDATSKLVKSQKFSMSPGQSQQASLTRLELGSPFAPHPLFWAQVAANSCTSNDGCTVDDCNIAPTGAEVDAFGNTDLVFSNIGRIAFVSPAVK